MPKLNNSEKANLIKDNQIKQRDARGCFMAATTSIEELNNPISMEELNNLVSVEELTNLTAAEELIISVSIKKVV